MFDNYPFLFMSAQNCSDMIVSIGNYFVVVRIGKVKDLREDKVRLS